MLKIGNIFFEEGRESAQQTSISEIRIPKQSMYRKKKDLPLSRKVFPEATGGLEPPNKSFADSPLTNLGTSP